MELPIVHDAEGCRFVCTVDAEESSVEYEVNGAHPPLVDVVRTFVPASLRGKGIAAELLRRFSEHARESAWTVKPSCSYALHYYRRNRQYASLVPQDLLPGEGGSCRLGKR